MSKCNKRLLGFKSGSMFVLPVLLLCCWVSAVAHENGTRTTVGSSELKSVDFVVEKPGEVGLEIEARSPGASWEKPGEECAAILVSLDHREQQDIFLFAGDQTFKYRIALGRLEQGKHKVIISLNRDRSAPHAAGAEILGVKPVLAGTDPFAPGVDGELAQKYSPVLYARANTIDHFSDIPLLMYYEVEHPNASQTLLTYSIIFTNEDGGTPSAALMARWGRGTDIEWVYRIRLNAEQIVEETYQGVGHETKPFRGERTMGMHPLLADASDNNNFSDLACSVMKFALSPVNADLSGTSRESVMDTYGWTYRIMAQELFRERRISDKVGDLNNLNTIADPRDYVYIEASSNQEGAAVAFELRLKDSDELFRSDLNDARLRIDRSGYYRSAVRIPHGLQRQDISEIQLRCFPTQGPAQQRGCHNASISKVMMLDETYVPRLIKISSPAPQNVSPGGVIIYHTKD
jgi:hypothetical protein